MFFGAGLFLLILLQRKVVTNLIDPLSPLASFWSEVARLHPPLKLKLPGKQERPPQRRAERRAIHGDDDHLGVLGHDAAVGQQLRNALIDPWEGAGPSCS